MKKEIVLMISENIVNELTILRFLNLISEKQRDFLINSLIKILQINLKELRE